MELQISNIHGNDSLIKFKCAPRIQSIYERYDSEDLFVILKEEISFDELIDFLLKNYRMRILGRKLNETLDGAISLIVNPFFNQLCSYIKENIMSIEKGFLKFLKKEVFDFFVSKKYIAFSKWIAENSMNSELSSIGEGKIVDTSMGMISLINRYI